MNDRHGGPRRPKESRRLVPKPGRAMTRASRPRVVVSRCLVGGRCRYDGAPVSASLVLSLGKLVTFVPVCPETGIGLPVPREPIRLVRTAKGTRLVQSETGRDLTGRMRSFCRESLSGLKADGFILKARSPSCAVRDAEVHRGNRRLAETRPGLFAEMVLRRFPSLPVEDEERLAEPGAMARFIARLFKTRPWPDQRKETS